MTEFFFPSYPPKAGDKKGKNLTLGSLRPREATGAVGTATSGAEPCLWVKLVLFGLGTWRRAAQSGQYSEGMARF